MNSELVKHGQHTLKQKQSGQKNKQKREVLEPSDIFTDLELDNFLNKFYYLWHVVNGGPVEGVKFAGTNMKGENNE